MSQDLVSRAMSEVGPLSQADLERLRPLLVQRVLPRGQHLLRAGARSEWLGVVTEGVLREYVVLPDGLERTKSFASEGAFAGSLPDALASRPAICSIVAELDTALLALRCEALFSWVQTSETTRAWATALYARQYVLKADRELELIGMDAWGRYEAFRRRFPGLEARVSQKLVASYLGITPEHLSRLRARRRSAPG